MESQTESSAVKDVRSASWELIEFKIQGNDTVIYANGRMQVSVNIIVKAIDSSNNTPYTLSENTLAGIELVDYYNTGATLNGGWTYTKTENEYAHVFPTGRSGEHDKDDRHDADRDDTGKISFTGDDRSGIQTLRYWVSSTKVESKNIGARMQMPGGSWVNTHSNQFDSQVTIRAATPVTYTMSNVTFDRQDTANGKGWDQDNYYLTTKVHAVKSTSIFAYKNENYNVVGMRQAISCHHRSKRNVYIQYMWPFGTQSTVQLGITHHEDGRPRSNPAPTVRIREQGGAMCFTRMWIENTDCNFSHDWWFEPYCIIYDTYGNSGQFNVHANHFQTISISDRNVSRSTEDDGKIHYGEKIVDEEIVED